ncbi:MAG TPA: AI-2E family transporter [Chitinophagaceae bacterium]
MNQQARFPYILRVASIFIVLVLSVMTLYYLKVVLVPILFSILFAVMLFPFSLRLERIGFAKGLAAFITVFVTTLLLGFLVYLIFTQLSTFFSQVPQLSEKMNKIVDTVRDFLVGQLGIKKSVMADQIQTQLNQVQAYSGSLLSDIIATLPSFLIQVFLIPLYVFFLLYYRHFFLEFFYKIFHASDKAEIDDAVENIGFVIKGYVFGQFLDIIIIGVVNTIALYMLGIGYAIILGFGVAVLCIIPYLGMIAGSIIALLVALLTTQTTWQPITAFGVLWFIHIIDSNLVAPYVIGSRVNINPLVAIFVLFLFGELWGLAGLFLAFPLVAILKVIFDRVPGLKSYGFLLGEPQKYHLKKNSMVHLKRMQSIQEMKEQTPMNDLLPGEPGSDPLPGDPDLPLTKS